MRARGATAWRGRSPTSTPRRSRRPTASARRCSQALGSLADLEPDAAFVEDLGDLADEVIDDLYVRAFHGDPAVPVRRGCRDRPRRDRQPGRPDRQRRRASWRAERRRLAIARASELDRRKQAMAVMTYDDLLTRLRAGARRPERRRRRGAAAGALRGRARRRVPGHRRDAVGDPAPRVRRARPHARADRATRSRRSTPSAAPTSTRISKAAEAAGSHWTLRTNWRSDQGLLDAYDALFAGARLGHAGIEYRTVEAAPAGRSSRLHGGGGVLATPLRLRIVPRRAVEQTDYGYARKPSTRNHIARDVAGRSSRCSTPGRRSRATRRRRSAPAASRSGPATSPCSFAPTARPRRSAPRSRPRRFRR